MANCFNPIFVSKVFSAPVGMKTKYHIRPIAVIGKTVGTKNIVLNNLYPLSFAFTATAKRSAIGVCKSTLNTTILAIFESERINCLL